MTNKILELKITFNGGAYRTTTTTEMNKSELFAYGMEKHKNELEKIESFHVEELKNPEVLMSRRAKKTHTVDDSGTKTICGESIDFEKVQFEGTRFRCEKCGN